MRSRIKIGGLILGGFLYIISFFFFGRLQDVYFWLCMIGACISGFFFLWIVFGNGSRRYKVIGIAVALLIVLVNWATVGILIRLSYKYYVSTHEKALQDISSILGKDSSFIHILNNEITDSASALSSTEKQSLLSARKELGAYMIHKSSDEIYIGVWGFLDVRHGVTLAKKETINGIAIYEPTGKW